LSIAYSIAHAHGGDLRVTSRPGETTFRLTLPDSRRERRKRMSAGRILVVDDEPQIRRIMRTTLTGAGYEVDDSRSGEEALEKVREFRPDLMLLDINMPGMGGLAACRALRADTQIAIIMLTVRNSEADKVKALDAGADDFVTKPFSTPELLARIRAALRRVPVTQMSPARMELGSLVIDFTARTVDNGGVTSHLTPKELDLLRYLTQHPTKRCPIGNCCRRCGDPITATRWITCACSSATCARKSK
jgi:two-component system KDP operon response regulator KdpE